MITMRIKGGLGNQLFQYACGYSLSRRLNQKLMLDHSFFSRQNLRGYKLGCLNIDFGTIAEDSSLPVLLPMIRNRGGNKLLRMMNQKVIPAGRNWKLLIETEPRLTEEFFTIEGKNIFVDGYFQSERYFASYRDDLLRQFTPCCPQEEEYDRVLNEIAGVNAVAVHVRRGDFLQAQYDRNPRHYLLSEDYYGKALEYIDSVQNNVLYFWFSDNIEWVRNMFGNRSDFRFVSLHTKHADIDELMLMKNCRHIITANSTFSWWAAWLNENKDAVIVCPEKAYGIPEMIPDRWKKLG